MELKTNTFNEITLKNTLKNHFTEASCIAFISEKIKQIPNINELRTNIELLLYTCLAIESIVLDNNIKCDKLEMLIKIYENVYDNIDDKERSRIIDNVTFLHQNQKIKLKNQYTNLKSLFRIIKKFVYTLLTK